MILSFGCTSILCPQLSLMLCLFVPSELQSFVFTQNTLTKHTLLVSQPTLSILTTDSLRRQKFISLNKKPRTLKLHYHQWHRQALFLNQSCKKLLKEPLLKI